MSAVVLNCECPSTSWTTLRCRVLIAAALAASRLLEVGELETRLAALEVALAGAHRGLPSGAAFGQTLLERAEGLAGVVGQLSAIDGHPAAQGRKGRARSSGIDLTALRTAARATAPAGAAYLVDEARCATVDLLGDGKAAAAIVERRLRASGL